MNTETPEQIIARVDALAERSLSPCGDGHMMARIWGSGQPLVLLHGNFGSWMHWIRNIEVLARQYRVIALDIPGFGDSALPHKPYNAASVSDIMRTGIRQIVGDEPINLAGFSFGASCSAALSNAMGEQMRKLLLVCSGRNMIGVTRAKLADFIKWRDFDTREERDAAHRRNLETIMIADPDKIDDLAIYIQRNNAERSRLRAIYVTEGGPIQTYVPNLKCPFAAIWSDHDQTIGPYLHERAAWLKRYRPDARHIIIPDAGHWCAYEAPDAFNAAMLELLP
jgi:pimeloyl-ACP methyl ester carboxylesterase